MFTETIKMPYAPLTKLLYSAVRCLCLGCLTWHFMVQHAAKQKSAASISSQSSQYTRCLDKDQMQSVSDALLCAVSTGADFPIVVVHIQQLGLRVVLWVAAVWCKVLCFSWLVSGHASWRSL